MLVVLGGQKGLILLTAISVWFGDKKWHLLKQIVIQITRCSFENCWKPL